MLPDFIESFPGISKSNFKFHGIKKKKQIYLKIKKKIYNKRLYK